MNCLGFVRESGRYLQSIKTLFALTQMHNDGGFANIMRKEMVKSIYGLKDAMGINQHHDAVAGTSKQAVANDYVLILSKALNGVKNVSSRFLLLLRI